MCSEIQWDDPPSISISKCLLVGFSPSVRVASNRIAKGQLFDMRFDQFSVENSGAFLAKARAAVMAAECYPINK